MSPTELAKVIDYCEDRWPGTRNFRQWDKAAWDFAGIPAEAVHEAARAHFNQGERTAPTLSQLRAEGARIAAQRGLIDPQSTSCDVRGHHSRSRAITELEDGNREAQCLDCGSTIIRPANQLLTVGEAEEIEQAGREAPADPIADRIAP